MAGSGVGLTQLFRYFKYTAMGNPTLVYAHRGHPFLETFPLTIFCNNVSPTYRLMNYTPKGQEVCPDSVGALSPRHSDRLPSGNIAP